MAFAQPDHRYPRIGHIWVYFLCVFKGGLRYGVHGSAHKGDTSTCTIHELPIWRDCPPLRFLRALSVDPNGIAVIAADVLRETRKASYPTCGQQDLRGKI